MADLPARAPVDYLEGLMEGFVAYDADWVMTYINASGERILGRRREDVLGKTWHQAFPHAVGNPVDQMYQRVKRTRVAEMMEYRYEHYRLWMEISACALSDGGVGVYFRDISDRKSAEETMKYAEAALTDLNAQLTENARRKDEFLAVLAHELRNPLAPIANAVEVMNLQGSRDPVMQGARDVISRQVGNMARLIDDLLDVGRITSGKLELRRERVELASVVGQALETSRPHLRGHEFTLALPGQPLWLDADPVRLAQVLSNLLNNACKYTPAGGRIRLSAERAGDRVLVKVRDNGIGIAPGQLPKLFHMFSQAAAPRGRVQGGGLGIGLALSRALVEMQGGRIEARSEGEGLGSEFVVTLQVLDEGAAPRAARSRSGQADPRRILVVDDNADSAASLAMLLRADGHTTEVAHDGERAVEAAAAFHPDAVLLDIGLPGMSGLDACRAIRSQAGNEHILIAALTGWGQEEDVRRSREAGFDAHLVKPVARDELVALFSAERRT